MLLWATNTRSKYFQCHHPVHFSVGNTDSHSWALFWRIKCEQLSLRCFCLLQTWIAPRPLPTVPEALRGRPCLQSAPRARRLRDVACVRRGCHLCAESPIPRPMWAFAARICVCFVGKARSVSPGIAGGCGSGSAGRRLCRLTGEQPLRKDLDPLLFTAKDKKK